VEAGLDRFARCRGPGIPLRLPTPRYAGHPLEKAAAAGRLGQGALVGDAVWDRQAKVRLRLGPLPRARYQEFLPGGTAHEELRQLTRFYGGEALEFGVQLVLARDEVPPCVLGADDEDGLRLGWSTWVRTEAPTRDPDDTILTL